MLRVQRAKITRNQKIPVVQCLTVAILACALTMLPAPRMVSARQSEAGANNANPSRQQVRERAHPAPSTQTIYAPLGLGRSYQAEIVLNNNSPRNMEVTPAFYTTAGTAIVGATVTLRSSEVRNMSVSNLMPSESHAEDMAGMTLTYFGGMLEVGAQITLIGQGGASSVDIPFSAGMDYRSGTLEAVWWMPKHAEATIILGNASDAQIALNLKYSDGQSQDVTLQPFATEILERNDVAQNSSEGVAESVRIESSGAIGSLRATGFVTSSDRRFNSGIRFYDPATIRQRHLFATNLRLKNSEPRLVLKNIGDTAISARPRFIPQSGESTAVFKLPGLSVQPHAAVEVDLRPLETASKTRSEFDMVSVQILNDSATMNLIGALYSTDLSTKTTYDVPLRDSGPVRNSTGSYPWRIDADYSTNISITNTRENATRYLVTINYEGGRYSLDPKELGADETVVFDLKKIRDDHIPDKDGNTIPVSVSSGQFRWSLIGDETQRLIGRSEVVSLSRRVSSSYSCPVCCADSFSGLVITPGSSVGPVGGTAVLTVNGFETDCYLNTLGPYAWSVSQWYIQNPSVISLQMVTQGSAQMGCLSVGTSQFTGTTFEVWYDNDGMDCYSHYTPFTDGCCATVVRVTFQTADGAALPSPLRIGITQTELDGNTVHNRTQHLRALVEGADPASVLILGDSRVSVSNQAVSGQYKTFDAVGTTKSDNRGDATIKAIMAGNQTVGTASVSVIIPRSIATPHDTNGGGLVIQNMALNVDTSPTVITVPSSQKELVTVYIRWLTITVKDQFGDLIGDIYPNAEISELYSATVLSIHQHLTSASTYTDPVGRPEGSTIVAATDTTAINNWINGSTMNPLPSGLDPVTQNVSVFVDNFRLQPDPAIANRTITFSGSGTTSPPVSVTISWPN